MSPQLASFFRSAAIAFAAFVTVLALANIGCRNGTAKFGERGARQDVYSLVDSGAVGEARLMPAYVELDAGRNADAPTD